MIPITISEEILHVCPYLHVLAVAARVVNTPSNPELWDELLNLCERHQLEIIWLKGHAGHPENERCDAMAVAQSKKYTKIN
jgi:ribonuclease HI